LIGAGATVLSAIGMGFEYAGFGESAHGQDDAHEGGADVRKVGVWAFLGSECVFFASLIATYIVYKPRNLSGPGPEIFNIPLTTFSTFVLLMSSLLVVLSLAAIQRGDLRWTARWLFATVLFGVVFLGCQVFEFVEFYGEGLGLQTNLFASAFYTLVGFHGAHVAVGVLWLSVLAAAAWFGSLTRSRALSVELAGLYWHFVDVVWIVIFTFVYLMEGVKEL
jgi:heme/copper-type cytochrome/quinol oxidase subunit 3